MKILTAFDGNLIVVAHITKVWYGLDHEGYRTASLGYIKFDREIRKEDAHPKLQQAMEEERERLYPNGKPELKDFYRTRVTLPDGSSHWVMASRDAVVDALLDA